MASLDEPTAGDVLINNVSVKEDPDSVRHLLGFVPDALPSHNDITVHEYLDFFARAYGIEGAKRRTAVESIEEFTKLTDIREKLLKSLSKGMKQRVSLGRALIHDPSALFMDEPAAGLDPRARIEFRELVTALADMGKAILISSHILTELTEICNGVVIIEKGRLLEQGTIAQVLSKKTARTTIVVRSLDRLDELYRHVLEMPSVNAVRKAENEVFIDAACHEKDCCVLLTELIKRGHQIIEFRPLRDDLEDIFMRVTKGDLQ